MTQTEINYQTKPKKFGWGGSRKNAGRPKKKNGRVGHTTRPLLPSQYPVLVTTRVLRHVWNMRTRRFFTEIHRALRGGKERFGFRVVHYTVQSNHFHFLVEAKDRRALARGMQGLKIRLARALNRVMNRKGQVFADRYHLRILKSPTEVRTRMQYVFNNARKHELKMWGRTYPAGWVDEYSSAVWFFGVERRWTQGCEVASPRTWLLTVGWRRGRGEPIKP